MGFDINVKIDLTKPSGSAGFGVPLILEEHATTEKSYTECTDISAVVAAGYAVGTKTYAAANLIFMQDKPPEKIAVCGASGTAAEWLTKADNVMRNWRQLIVICSSEDADTDIDGIAAAVEALDGKMYFSSVAVKDETEHKSSSCDRTVVFYCDSTDTAPVPEAALVGATAGKNAGSFTYKNQILKGIAAQKLLDSEVAKIHEKGGITFVEKAGDAVTSEGKTLGGEYIDVVDSKDFIINEIRYRVQKLLNASDKIPYTDSGIAQIESVVIGVLREAWQNGMISTNEDGDAAYSVDFDARSESSETDRAVRTYRGGKFTFELAGAIHTGEIVGQIIL